MDFSTDEKTFNPREQFDDTSKVKSKTCSSCQKTLLCEFFYKNKSKRDGYESYCKRCAKKRNKKRLQERKIKRSQEFTIAFNGFPDERVFISKLQPLIEEILHGEE